MQGELVAQIVVALLGFLGTWGMIAYFAGRLTKAQEDLSRTQGEHSEMLQRHTEQISEHSVELGRLDEWKKGFSVGTRFTNAKELGRS
jgi:hypothetical protein